MLQKNFKILFRKKTSFFTIFLGPLFVILLMSFTFSSNSEMQMSIGYISPDDSPLTNEFVTNLKTNYLAKQFWEKDTCVHELESGLMHACILFPENFEIENNKTNNIIFVVDKSRISLVYSVIESISSDIDVKTEELSKDLTDKIVSTLTNINTKLDSTLAIVIKTKAKTTEQEGSATEIGNDMKEISDDLKDVDFTNLDTSIDSLHQYTKNIYDGVYSEAGDCLDIVETSEMDATLAAELEDELTAIRNVTKTNYDNSSSKITDIATLVDSAISTIEKIETLSSEQSSSLTKMKTDLSQMTIDLGTVKSNIESMQNEINNIQVTSTENIVNPITTSIETTSSAGNNKLALIFPYLLILLIMFTSLLLSSTLVVVEKESNAAFRTFTTPTRDEFFVFTTFLTAFMVVIIQLIIILAAVSYFLFDFILANIYVNITLILLATALFIMLGMMIGYLLKTQQATNMATIFLGTILLFISNIVFPIETISPSLKLIAQYNPFVITSELLRQSIVFNTGFSEMALQLAIIFFYSIIFLVLILMFQKISKSNYFNKFAHMRSGINKFVPESILIDAVEIKSKEELVSKLENIDDEKYDKFKKDSYKQFKEFLEVKLDEDKLGNLKKMTREQLITKLKNRIQKNEELIKNDSTVFDGKYLSEEEQHKKKSKKDKKKEEVIEEDPSEEEQ
ncbi:MAG: ABC transporter permease [Candidatus Nanoarchaeia archaeon]|nr:ABC transporter permease [Candidatus Nanoarchaeia archaeon]